MIGSFVGALIAVVGLAASLQARSPHEGLDESITRVSAAIEASPLDAALFLARANLHRVHADLAACEADLERVDTLDPKLSGLLLGRARLACDRGQIERALELTDAELATDDCPLSVRISALELRAELLGSAGNCELAVEAWSALLALDTQPKLEWYLARAALQAPSDALVGLDAALVRHGQATALVLAACDIEERLGRPAAACSRIDHLILRSPRPETLLALQGDIYTRAGLEEAARERFLLARAALERLPRRHRLSPTMVELAAHLAQRLDGTPQDSAR